MAAFPRRRVAGRRELLESPYAWAGAGVNGEREGWRRRALNCLAIGVAIGVQLALTGQPLGA